MTSPLFIAVDLGAGSGRVFLAGIAPGQFFLEEIHRFQYPPRMLEGCLRWDFWLIFNEIRWGLKLAGSRAHELARPVRSIGVDSWAVDYGLVDSKGELIADPVCYRDDRTTGVMDRVFARVPRKDIFEKTGIQFQNFNTLFQLYSEGSELAKASQMLLLPDLINYCLTGRMFAEYTNATTTQMVNAATGGWDLDLIATVDLPPGILPEIMPAGTDLGPMKSDMVVEMGLAGVKIVAPATHDTASAVAAAPIAEGRAYISSGTWSLIGIEADHMLINDDVARHNFTNEGGVYGTVRFLKNVMGLWILEACRREWAAAGIDTAYEAIITDAAAIGEPANFIFPDDPRFLNPPSMLAAIAEQLTETDQAIDNRPAFVAKIIFDSLAMRYASVLRTIEVLTGGKLKGVEIVGGGGRNRYLSQMTANAAGLPVRTGLTEATVVGNVLVQAITARQFASHAEARECITESFEFENFEPHSSAELDKAAARYAEVENRYESLSMSN